MTEIVDDQGKVIERCRYSPYGKLKIYDSSWNELTASTLGNPYFFTGREYDPESGLYYYRARMYSPVLGRFLQPDPIGYLGGMNLNIYCSNNPVNFIDPDGLRVINNSNRTIPVVVNERLPGGEQGPQEILYLLPGGDTDMLKPGWDTDGIFPPADNTRVIKLVDDVISEVLPSGGVRFPWYNNPINTVLQLIFGGWKDEAFLNQWKWPRPDPGKCN